MVLQRQVRMLAAMELDHSGQEVLDESECLRLLATAGIGRLGLSVDALPAVFPVYFGLIGRDPVFERTTRPD